MTDHTYFVRPIRSEEDYEATLVTIDRLFDAEPGTKEAGLLDVLVGLVMDYEDEHYPIEAPVPMITANDGITLLIFGLFLGIWFGIVYMAQRRKK